MARMTVKVVGESEMREALESLEQHLRDGAEQAVQDTVEEVAQLARDNAPVVSGDLRDSISGTVDGLLGTVAVEVFYASWVEFGTSGGRNQASPFLVPAAQEGRANFVRRLKDMGASIR